MARFYPTHHLFCRGSMGSAVRVWIAVLRQINRNAEQSPPCPNSLLVFVGQAVTDVGSMVNACQGDVAT